MAKGMAGWEPPEGIKTRDEYWKEYWRERAERAEYEVKRLKQGAADKASNGNGGK